MDLLNVVENSNAENEVFFGDDIGVTVSVGYSVESSTQDVINSTGMEEDYDYDMEASHNIFFWEELLPTLIVYCLTFVLGLVGNVLIVFTISRYRKMKSTTNVFLASLASADLLLIVFCIPVKLAKLFSFSWTLGFFLCKLVHYMQSVSAICSVLTLTAMSIERYYAIVHPMRAQYVCTISQARRIIIGTWISAFLLAVPILFAQVHLTVGFKVKAYWCVRDWDNKTVWRAHELYMLLLILVIPTGVMGVAYTAICWEVWEVMQRRQVMTAAKSLSLRSNKRPCLSQTSSNGSSLISDAPMNLSRRKSRRVFHKMSGDDDTPVKQVIKMLVAVVVIYVLCWGPMLIDNVLQAYGVLPFLRTGSLKYMGTAFHLMAYFNSCINPVVYGFMSKNFRESFQKTLCCDGSRQSMPVRSFSISQTRNSSYRYAESSFGRTVSIAVPD